MTDTPTPGQVAYEAYWPGPGIPYGLLPAHERRNWERAAQAVITAWIASPDWPTPQPQEETP